jgi:hypothetical protein
VPPEVELAGLDTIEYAPDIYFPEVPREPAKLVEPDGSEVEADQVIHRDARELIER